MDFAASPVNDVVPVVDDCSTSVNVEIETKCWGCGLNVAVSPHTSDFKCGWCGAVTKGNLNRDQKYFRWRLPSDRCLVYVVLGYLFFFICGGIWAVYPVVFSISYYCGVFHFMVAVILATCTLSAYSLAAFRPAGAQPMIIWGSYPTVGKGGLEDFTFCRYCSKPKSPRTHHCRSCGICVLDMDHHCPFIGNCVGVGNHRSFILFLISAVISTCYTFIMTSYATLHIWPPLHQKPAGQQSIYVLKENILAFLRSVVSLPARGFVLAYLVIASFSVGIGLSVLLWQQLGYIYTGKTYLSQLSSVDSDGTAEGDCQNIFIFLGCPRRATSNLPSYWKSRKSHEK
ncbi:protein S-acyltransferase 11-like [Henckelia pumila]|uniref:protein S-acyltransferase 11-like n=1 Tax=Henckelia pumila TaxID=405737 RepID=UPI003C6E5A2E